MSMRETSNPNPYEIMFHFQYSKRFAELIDFRFMILYLSHSKNLLMKLLI